MASLLLCTCSDKVDTNKPHWVLERASPDTQVIYLVGLILEPNHEMEVEEITLHEKVLKQLNEKMPFDFTYQPINRDRLTIHSLSGVTQYIFNEEHKWELEPCFGAQYEYQQYKSGYIKSKP